MEVIRSKSNRLIKETKKLHQKKYRKHSYLIEGWHLFEEACQAHATIERVFVTEEAYPKVIGDFPVTVVSSEIIQELADSQTPQGVVAQVALPKTEMPEEFGGKYLVLEDIQDPGNLGTMVRTADAAGYDAVFLSDKSADIYSLKTLRSMQGSHFHLPIYRVAIEELLAQFKNQGVQILATTLSKDSIDYKAVTAVASFAIIMGNEGQGISTVVEGQADTLLHISMPGQAESLNVAVAAGILLFSFI
ncbi:23S rRNA methyltransferase [Streptococcus azizii]|uniref:23S rRNA methyltransferase n=1 Tax=Streptococcus azizii TaxID=1579424 RepID=A0AB36JT49_9STRE|nr:MULTISPECIES: RNA methyltransferase [Streptococcus]MBF0775338.1 RNA methyltransferase [Streptococcus sp. 19428wD3_AN2]ONK29609.1 23S rRNA methyltransferase [Streptococcus azizii]ONK30118.1 23S rRNA methyltransferase [Streptococcus azizii]ONK30893.1 23S rRNA methyltransferase [Streptococcus azizii]TFU84863.1 RNA methyltransferase [Streptococcus sp. AN2]